MTTALLLIWMLACSVPERPNIVLITLDTTRADHVSAYGYYRETTPNLDALADDSIFFENLIVPMATTLPTHTSIFTGTFPLEHGVMANVTHGGQRFQPSPNLKSFAQYLREAGYQTGAVVSATPLKRGSGIESGFDWYDQPQTVHRPAGRTTNQAALWARKARKKGPFFLWVHYFDPHGPFLPPEPYDQAFQNDDTLDSWLDERGFGDVVQRPTGQEVDPRTSSNAYDGEIQFMDSQIGTLIARAERQGWWDDAIVIVMGDHGEGLGQHHMAGHGDVWREQLHAPFFIRSPWHRARRVSQPVSAVDVIPTLLGLIELPGEEAFLAQVSGRDALSPEARRPIFSQTSDRQVDYQGTTRIGLTVGDWRYLRDGNGREQLFDLAEDPHEQVDLAELHPALLHAMRSWALETQESLVRRGEELGHGEAVPLDDETLEALGQLGYLDDAQETEPAEPEPAEPEPAEPEED